MVRQVVRYNQRQEQVHTRHSRRTAPYPLCRRYRLRGALPAKPSRQPTLRRKGTHPRRKPCAQLQRQPLARRRPQRHPHREHQPAGQPRAGTQEGDCPAQRLRAEARPHCPRDALEERHQHQRRALLDALRADPCARALGKTLHQRRVAQHRGVLPRRSGLRTVSPAI